MRKLIIYVGMSVEKNWKQRHIFERKIREYEKRLIDFFLEMGEISGRSSVIYAIIGYLLIHGSLTQKQLKNLTGFSIGSISNKLNALTSIGAITKKLIKGTHTFEYSFGGDLSQVLSNTSFFKFETFTVAIKFVQTKINELNEKNNQNKKGYKILSKRMAELLNFLLLGKKLLDALTSSDIVKKMTNVEMRRG